MKEQGIGSGGAVGTKHRERAKILEGGVGPILFLKTLGHLIYASVLLFVVKRVQGWFCPNYLLTLAGLQYYCVALWGLLMPML